MRALTERLVSVAGWSYLLACYAFIFLPVVVLVLFSFHDGSVPVPPFEGPTLRWYGEAFANRRLMSGLWNSLLVGALSALAATALGFLAAYGLARHRLRSAPWLRGLIILPLTVSYLIVGMGLLIVFNALGVKPSLWSVGIGHVVINLPLAFAIVLSQLGEHQQRLEAAARDLGASTWRVIRRVTLPGIWPALCASFCLCFTLSWDEFIIAFLLTRFDVTMPVVIWSMLKTGLDPETNAAGTLVFALSLLLAVFVELVLLRRGRAA